MIVDHLQVSGTSALVRTVRGRAAHLRFEASLLVLREALLRLPNFRNLVAEVLEFARKGPAQVSSSEAAAHAAFCSPTYLLPPSLDKHLAAHLHPPIILIPEIAQQSLVFADLAQKELEEEDWVGVAGMRSVG